MAYEIAPLPHEWMIASIIGFFVSWLMVFNISMKWGTAFMLVFILMFIAAIYSMTHATTEEEHLKVLAVHYKKK